MSKHEEKVLSFITGVAESRGLRYRSDKTGNLVVFKDGCGQGINAPTVILQGHVDMVCEKNNDVKVCSDIQTSGLPGRNPSLFSNGRLETYSSVA